MAGETLRSIGKQYGNEVGAMVDLESHELRTLVNNLLTPPDTPRRSHLFTHADAYGGCPENADGYG